VESKGARNGTVFHSFIGETLVGGNNWWMQYSSFCFLKDILFIC